MNRKTGSRIGIFLAGLLAVLLAGSASRAERVEIEFWHGMGSAHGRTVNAIVDEFNESQDKYTVVPVYQGRYNSLGQKLIASLYARRNPALSQMYPGWSSRYYRYGYLQPIDHFMADDPEFTEEDIADFYPVMIQENRMTHPKTGKTELISLPFNKSVYMLFVNQSRMESLGWKEPPKTWEELRRLAKEMTIMPEGASRPTMHGFATRTFIEDFEVQAFSAGTQLFDETTETPLVESAEARAALEFLKSLVSGGESNRIGYVESDFLNSAFGSEQIGMYVSSTASFPYNDAAVGQKFVWRAYRMPGRDANTDARTLMQGTNVGIFGNVPEEQQRGAWEFVKFLTSAETTAKWAMETGYMPVRRSAKETPELKAYMESNPRYKNAVDTLEYASYEPRLMYWESVRTTISQEVEAVLQGRKSVDDALAEMDRTIRQIRDGAE